MVSIIQILEFATLLETLKKYIIFIYKLANVPNRRYMLGYQLFLN